MTLLKSINTWEAIFMITKTELAKQMLARLYKNYNRKGKETKTLKSKIG